jgi:hypothetical protein
MYTILLKIFSFFFKVLVSRTCLFEAEITCLSTLPPTELTNEKEIHRHFEAFPLNRVFVGTRGKRSFGDDSLDVFPSVSIFLLPQWDPIENSSNNCQITEMQREYSKSFSDFDDIPESLAIVLFPSSYHLLLILSLFLFTRYFY